MFARLIRLKADPAKSAELEKMADGALAAMRNTPGFVSANFFMDRETGAGGALSLWETREALEAFGAASGPSIIENFGSILQGAPEIEVYEHYEP